MDTESFSPSSSFHSYFSVSSRNGIRLQTNNPHVRRNYGDRFIPNRASMDWDYARCQLLDANNRKSSNTDDVLSQLEGTYKKQLAEVLMMNRDRILSFKEKPLIPRREFLQEIFSGSFPSDQLKPIHPRHISQTEIDILAVPDIIDNYYLNLLDWSSSNIIAIALRNKVYLWNVSNESFFELVNVDIEKGPITSICWDPNGERVAVGMNGPVVELWDATTRKKLRTLQGMHQGLVGSLAWNKHILTTGGIDSKINNIDVRIRSSVVQRYIGHQGMVCRLKWSDNGKHLASGGTDSLLHIWDIAMASQNSATQWLHRFDSHKAVVTALSWCPFQSNILATGGDVGDGCIKFWNIETGNCIKSFDTGSPITSLLWSKKENELLSSHALFRDQLVLWKCPSMTKLAKLSGHTSRVLNMVQSPNGCTIASTSSDESLRFWNVFGVPKASKPRKGIEKTAPFSSVIAQIR